MDEQKRSIFEGLSIPEIEEKMTELWEREGVFLQSLQKTKDGVPFTFYDGPPFATGLPHYGHLLASTVKDLIPRYQTMRGRYVRRRWGWDCHGLPIEEIVERELKISGKKQIEEIGIKKFNETCRSMVLTFVDEWRKTIRRLGRWVDFDNSYKTMDRTFMESVWWGFKELYDKGLVYEGRKVLLYCPRCETPVSNFEVAMDNSYKDVTEESVFVKFKVKPDQAIGNQALDGNIYLLAWTTTPWTLPGNVALAVGPDIQYSEVIVGGNIYIVATHLVAKLFSMKGEELVGRLYKGSELAGIAYEPLFEVAEVTASDKAHKVYAADFVTTEDGTGIVHTAVVYGEDDYQLGLREGLPVVPLLDEKGHFNDKAPELVRGKYFKGAEKDVKEDLEKRGLLLKREMSVHSYPHCWRCSTPLYYNAIPAWFINIQKIKKDLLDSNEREINWFPEHLKRGRYQKSVEAAPDWNISRNRYWGNPIPVWKCVACEEVKVAGSVADLKLPKTTFYFVRHGEAELNVEGIISSYPEKKEYALTESGRAAAKAAGERLSKKSVDVIYSSDLRRAKETADLIGTVSGKEVKTDPRLREFDLGDWNGKTYKDFKAEFPMETRWSRGPNGGETFSQIQARMLDFVNEMVKKHPGEKVVVVSHGDPIMLAEKYFGVFDHYPLNAEEVKVEVDLIDMHRPYIDEVVLKCEKCGGEAKRIPEIFDSWVEAGSMPFAEFHYPFENQKTFESRYPAQFVVEYIAQTRAWFYVMHVLNFVLFKKAPFLNVLTTGTILAADGAKMSKSKKNYPDPWDVINKYGVDSLRFYLMSSVVMQAENLNFNEKDLESVHRKVTMLLWNVYQYYATYASEESRIQNLESSNNVLDRWIRARTKELVREVTDNLDKYNTVHASRAIAEYVDDLSTWYLRRSRGRTDEGFFATFCETLVTVASVVAPFMPHIAEAVYQGVRQATSDKRQGENSMSHVALSIPQSVHLMDWPKVEDLTDEEKKLLEDMSIIRKVASIVHSMRKENNLAVKQPLVRMYVLTTKGEELKFASELSEILLAEVNIKSLAPMLLEGLLEAKDENYVVYVNSDIPDELKFEGLARSLTSFVQKLRKKNSLKVGDLAALMYETQDEDVERALGLLDKSKTYLATIGPGNFEGGEVFVQDGKKAILKLRKPTKEESQSSF